MRQLLSYAYVWIHRFVKVLEPFQPAESVLYVCMYVCVYMITYIRCFVKVSQALHRPKVFCMYVCMYVCMYDQTYSSLFEGSRPISATYMQYVYV